MRNKKEVHLFLNFVHAKDVIKSFVNKTSEIKRQKEKYNMDILNFMNLRRIPVEFRRPYLTNRELDQLISNTCMIRCINVMI